MINPYEVPDPFVGGLSDRIANGRADVRWSDYLQQNEQILFLPFVELKPLINLSGPRPVLARLTATEMAEVCDVFDPNVQHNMVLLGKDANADGQTLVAIACDSWVNGMGDVSEKPFSSQGKFIDTRSISLQLPHGEGGIAAQARSLLAWHGTHGFCHKCGTQTQQKNLGAKRQCLSVECAEEHFPRNNPVVIMMVVDGDRALLGRPPHLATGVYTALAGFIDQGETIEAAVKREIFEEAGVYVGRVAYVQSQPWPFPYSLMIGCVAQAESHDITIDQNELEDVQWFDRAQVRQGLQNSLEQDTEMFRLPPPIAIAHHLARHWVSCVEKDIPPF